VLSQINQLPIIMFNNPNSGANISGTVNLNVSCYDPDGDSILGGVSFYHTQNMTVWIPIGTDLVGDFPYYEVPWDTSMVPNGVYTIRAEASDDKGAFNHTDITNVEVYAPPDPIVTPIFPLDNGTITGVKELTVKVSLYTNITGPGVSFYISDDNATWTLIDNRTEEKALGVYNTSFDSTSYADGLYYFLFNVTDVSGKRGEAVVSNVTIINDYAPEITFVYPVGGETLAGNVSIVVNVIDLDDDLNLLTEGVTFYYHRLTEDWTEIAAVAAPINVGSTMYSTYLDTTQLDNGDDYAFRAKAVDLTGLTTYALTPNNISIFNTFEPAIELLPPVEPLKGTVTLTANVTDLDRNINSTRGVQFAYSKDKSDWTLIDKATSPLDTKAEILQYEVDWNVYGLPNGQYWIKANVSDYHGSMAEDMLASQVLVQNIHWPEIEILKPIESEGGVSGIYTIEVYAFDEDGDINASGVTLYYAKPGGNPAWQLLGTTDDVNDTFVYTYDWDTTALENGNYILKARVTDETEQSAEDEQEIPFKVENSVDADSDVDGMPDTWEFSNFGSLDEGPADDYDNDGFTNLAEYIAGTDPDDSSDYPTEPVVEEDSAAMKFLKDNWLILLIVIVVVLILIIVLIVVIVKLKKKAAKKREQEGRDAERMKALDDLHKGMDQMVKDMAKMEVVPGQGDDSEYIPPSTEFFADSTPIYETDQWGAAGEVDASTGETYQEETPIYAVGEEDEEEEEVVEEEDEFEIGEDDEDEDEELDTEDILGLEEDEVEIDEDEVEIQISKEEIAGEEDEVVEEAEGPELKKEEKKPPAKKEKPPEKEKTKKDKHKGKKKHKALLEEIDEDDVEIDDAINLRVR